jgi:AraC family transcriptional regulator
MATITVVLTGDFTELLPQGLRLCQPATILVKPAGLPHSNRYGARGAHCLIVELDETDAAAEGLSLSGEHADIVYHVHGGAARVGRRLVRAHRDRDDMGRMSLESLLYEVLDETRASQRRPSQPTVIQRSIEFLHDGFRQPMRLRDVARAAGVQPTYLARAFRRHFDRTPGDVLRELRVSWAARLVLETSTPLSHVAMDSGFADQSHLTRVFRRCLGMTPARLRRDSALRSQTG